MMIPDGSWAELEASALVTLHGGSFLLSHPLVATATLAAALPVQRRAAHRVLAAVLTGAGQAEQRAWHLAEATLGTDERVAAALEEMASVARARSGYAAAVTALERAAALSEDDAGRARRLFAAAADAQLAGQSARARDMLIAADGLAEGAHLRVAVAAVRSRVEAITGQPKVAHLILHQAAQLIEGTDRQRRAELLADSALAALLAGDPAAAITAAGEAEQLVTEPTASVALVARLIKGITLLHLGQRRDGALLLDGCAAIARYTGPDRPTLEYVILASAAMTWIGRHDTAREMVTPVLNQLRTAGAVGMLPFALYALALAEVRIGRTASATAAASEAVELAELTGNSFWRYLALSTLTYVEAVRGNAERCRNHGRAALAMRPTDGDYPRDAAEALGLLELSLGRNEECIEWFHVGAQTTPTSLPANLVEGNRDLMEALIRSGRGLTPQMIMILTDLTGNSQFPLDAAIAWRVTGLAAGDAEFAECFTKALKLHGDVVCPLETGRTHLAFGERLRRSGQRVQARAHLRPALEIFEQLHARVWADRARTELNATGETLRRPATTSAIDDLTPQELHVARTVIRGATNREAASVLFLSTKTVEFHLGNVFRKLGVRTRTELAHRLRDVMDPHDAP
jgi:DNA-binding CsgD family transcriptional regulator